MLSSWSLRAGPWHQAVGKYSAQEQAVIIVEVKKHNKAISSQQSFHLTETIRSFFASWFCFLDRSVSGCVKSLLCQVLTGPWLSADGISVSVLPFHAVVMRNVVSFQSQVGRQSEQGDLWGNRQG